MIRRARGACILLVLLTTAGCATRQGTVVLLPDPAGRQTAVVVTQDGRESLLQQPYAGAQITSRGPKPYASSAQDVEKRFGAALSVQPQRPVDFTLYFVEGKDEFTEASRQSIDGVFAEIAKRPVPDVFVIGHTDTMGSDAVNDPLSRQRAEVVRRALIERGIAADTIVAIGRGKREPVIPTGDGVAEPRNRRVEVEVR